MPQPFQYKISLHSEQAKFTQNNKLYRAYIGGRGAGKTRIGAYDLLKRTKPGRLYGVYAPTYKVLSDATGRTLLQIARDMGLLKFHSKAASTIYLGNEAEIIMRSLEDPDNARGPNMSGAWIDEMSVLSTREGFDIVIASLREGGEMGFFTATYTPKGKKHFTYDIFPDDHEKHNTAIFRSRTADNPFLPDGFVDVLRSQYTSAKAAQELDAKYVDFSGGLFKREWFNICTDYPRDCRKVRFWDLAATIAKPGNDPDYTAGALLGEKHGKIYILDVKRVRQSPADNERLIRQTAQEDGLSTPISIEQEGGSSGKIVIDHYARKILQGFAFTGERATTSKEQRADPIAAAAENGNVHICKQNWTKQVLDELEEFPSGRHDDVVDAISGAFAMLNLHQVSIAFS